MGSDLTRLIEACFLEHDGDGEFLSGVRGFPYSVIGTLGNGGCTIFTTKPMIASAAIHESGLSESYGMVGRYGLPNKADLAWIRKVIGKQPLLFLGDMDPVDLMVFVWLRASLRPKQVIHLGVNDYFLKAVRFPQISSLSIPCAPSERKSLALLRKLLPDLCDVVGDKCTKILERGTSSNST